MDWWTLCLIPEGMKEDTEKKPETENITANVV
jgi:hypothetical protein